MTENYLLHNILRQFHLNLAILIELLRKLVLIAELNYVPKIGAPCGANVKFS